MTTQLWIQWIWFFTTCRQKLKNAQEVTITGECVTKIADIEQQSNDDGGEKQGRRKIKMGKTG